MAFEYSGAIWGFLAGVFGTVAAFILMTLLIITAGILILIYFGAPIGAFISSVFGYIGSAVGIIGSITSIFGKKTGGAVSNSKQTIKKGFS